MHRENIKAELRKAYGSLGAFETKTALKRGSVRDVLRGRTSAPTERAIATALKLELHEVFPHRYRRPQDAKSSTKRDASTPDRIDHRLTGRRL